MDKISINTNFLLYDQTETSDITPKYCLKNMGGLRLKPLCSKNIILTQKSYNKGYRITANTLGLGRSVGATKVYIMNEYTFVKKRKVKSEGETSKKPPTDKIITIVFVFEALIKSTNLNSQITDQMMMSVNLSLILVKKDNKFVRNYYLESELDKLKMTINKKMIPIRRDIEVFNIDILQMMGIDSIDMMKRIIVNLMKGKPIDNPIDTVYYEKNLRYSDLILKIQSGTN